MTSYKTLEMTETRSLKLPEEQAFPVLDKYVQDQKHSTINKRAINNMMGAIDFSVDKHRQNKIARTFKETIGQGLGDEGSDRKNKKKEEMYRKYCNSRNRTTLESEFHLFLDNKNKEFTRLKEPRIEDDENYKIKKMALVNPEQAVEGSRPDGPGSELPLNLFHFQGRSPPKPVRNSNMSSILRSTPVSIAKARLEKKMYKLGLNQGP